MTIDRPRVEQISALRQLWQEAFGDSQDYLDSFFSLAFSPDRCRCMTEGHRVTAAVYWFDCSYKGEKLAYLYALATAEDRRGQGLGRRLMDDTHTHLKALGYAGAVLVPASDGLRKMYEKMGYLPGTRVRELRCRAGEQPVAVKILDRAQYEARRRAMLPDGGVLQEGAATALLADQFGLFGGEDFLLAAWIEEGVLHAEELLGNADAAPGILNALGVEEGIFRMPGEEMDFAMYRPFTENCPKPGYFGISLG